MTLTFLAKGTGQPFVRLDGRTGQFLLSSEDGEPQAFTMTDKLLALDLNRAVQGWLCLGKDRTDWQPLAEPGEWVDRPSPDHSDGVSVMLHCPDWPAPQQREFRGSSRAITSFIENVSREAGEIPQGHSPRIMIKGVRTKRYGVGSSVDVLFEMAPPDKWAEAAIFDANPMDGIGDSDIDADTVPTPKSKWG